MIAMKLRAVLMALLLGAGTVVVVGIQTTTPAEAALRSVVGKPLQDAKNLAAAGNYSAAMARVHEAEAVGGLTAEERQVINQMKEYISIKSGGSGGEVTSAAGAKAKFANDYNAGRYNAVIGQDADLLRKYGALDGNSMQIVAQAYYKMGNYGGCSRYIASNFGSGGDEALMTLRMRCAYESGDQDAMRATLEDLVARTGKPEYWDQLLHTVESTKGLKDHQTLDIYRIKYLTNSMKSADDYSLLAQLAIQMGFPAEAQTVVEKGIQAKILTGERTGRLLNMAKGQAAANAASGSKRIAAADAAKTGDADVNIGEELWGLGKYQDAIAKIQAGIQKGVADKDNAMIRLGMAQLGAGNKDAALKSFAKAKNDPKQAIIARLWSLYARGH